MTYLGDWWFEIPGGVVVVLLLYWVQLALFPGVFYPCRAACFALLLASPLIWLPLARLSQSFMPPVCGYLLMAAAAAALVSSYFEPPRVSNLALLAGAVAAAIVIALPRLLVTQPW